MPSKVEGQNPDSKPQSPGSKPLTRVKGRWHLERERERLENLIADLEAQIQAVLTKANAPNLHHLEAELEQAFARWAEVTEQLEGL